MTFAAIVVMVSVFSDTVFAAIMVTTEPENFDGTPVVGYLFVNDDNVTGTTVYSRSGSYLYLTVTVGAEYRYGGKDHYLSDYNYSNGGGTTATVYLSLEENPNAVFLKANGVHTVEYVFSGNIIYPSWTGITEWKR